VSGEIGAMGCQRWCGGEFYCCAQRHRFLESVNGRPYQLLRQRSISGSLQYISVSGAGIFQSAKPVLRLSGIIQPAIVQVMFYRGIVRLGVSRAGPIGGTSPFFWGDCFFLLENTSEVIVYLGGLLIPPARGYVVQNQFLVDPFRRQRDAFDSSNC
jgi:hypothetical protein